jgi:hypothetical protein
LEFYAEDENDFNRFVSTWNFTIMFKFKLQDIQPEEHYIPNWNCMPKPKKKKSSKRNCLISRINQKLPDYVRVQVTRYSTRRTLYSKLEFYAENENGFIDTCQPRISLICSSSSYKIFNEKNIIFQIGILCRKKKEKNISSKRNCLISRINPKLPDYVRVQVTRYST